MKIGMLLPVLIVSIVAVVAVSGCVVQDLLSGILPGADVIKPSRSTLNVGTSSPVLIGKVFTLPESSVLPDRDVRLFVEFSNVDTDPLKKAENVVLELYDPFLFKDENKHLCVSKTSGCEPDVCSVSNPCATIVPGATKRAAFHLISPSLNEIASVLTTAKLFYKISYNYSGDTNFETLGVTENEILRLEQSGDILSTSLDDKRSSGPIKIYIVAGTKYFIKSQMGAFLVFKLKDEGNGGLKDSKIEPRTLTIKFPKALAEKVTTPQGEAINVPQGTILTAKITDRPFVGGADLGVASAQTSGNACNTDFSCINGVGEDADKVVCENKNCIELFKGESEPMQFLLDNIGRDLGDNRPHGSYLISANVKYRYEIRGQTQIEINPYTSIG